MVTLIIQLAISLKKDKLAPPPLVDSLRQLIGSGNYQEAWETCNANKNYLANVLKSGLSRIGRGKEAVETALAEHGMREVRAWQPPDMRARLAGLERRVNHPLADPTRLAPDCLKELESAVGQLEVVREQLQTREAELRAMRAQLGDWRQRLLTLGDSLDGAYLLTELDGVILEANQAAARLLNLSSRFLTGRPLHLFLAAERVEFLRFLQNLPGCPAPEQLILRIRPRERHCLHVAARARIVPDASGRPLNVQWLIADAPNALPLPSSDPPPS